MAPKETYNWCARARSRRSRRSSFSSRRRAVVETRRENRATSEMKRVAGSSESAREAVWDARSWGGARTNASS
jgi:hypothetical protein